MKVKQLIEILQNQNPDASVKVTWEGIFRDISLSGIYRNPRGTLMIDADENSYKKRILSGQCGARE